MAQFISLIIDFLLSGITFIISAIPFLTSCIVTLPNILNMVYPYGTIVLLVMSILIIKMIIRKGE